ATDFSVQVDDVLGLRSNGLVVRWTQRGTARDGRGAFETTLLMLWVLGPDGLATHNELFAVDREAEALARFDELTAEPMAAPSRVAERRMRRVRANAASNNTARTDIA